MTPGQKSKSKSVAFRAQMNTMDHYINLISWYEKRHCLAFLDCVRIEEDKKYTAQAGIHYKPDPLGCVVPTNEAGKELENLHIRGALNTCSYENWALRNRTDQKEEGTPKHWCNMKSWVCICLPVLLFVHASLFLLLKQELENWL